MNGMSTVTNISFREILLTLHHGVTMSQREETVQEFLDRGGKITTLPPSPNWTAAGSTLYVSDSSPSEPEMIRTVGWRELYDSAEDETEDRTYWTKLNKRLDKVLKRMEK